MTVTPTGPRTVQWRARGRVSALTKRRQRTRTAVTLSAAQRLASLRRSSRTGAQLPQKTATNASRHDELDNEKCESELVQENSGRHGDSLHNATRVQSGRHSGIPWIPGRRAKVAFRPHRRGSDAGASRAP